MKMCYELFRETGKNVCRTEGMQERRDSGLQESGKEGLGTGGFGTGAIGDSRMEGGGIHDCSDTGKDGLLGYRKGGIRDCRDTGKEEVGTGVIWD